MYNVISMRIRESLLPWKNSKYTIYTYVISQTRNLVLHSAWRKINSATQLFDIL
jgi:hypothetical protein